MTSLDVCAQPTLGCYELLVPLGSGGMATVWVALLCSARGFQKLVAIKLMHACLQSAESYERMFLDEARIASRVRHPNVVEIYDLCEQDGVPYQVMEWVDGEPLSVVLGAWARGPLPIPLAVQIALQVCAGLHAAHQLRDDEGAPVGLVHRDVSPQNVLLGFDGIVKIVDFGVAKASCNSDRTAAGTIKGKIAYMAPEQFQALEVTRRTDVFALGGLLYLMIAGKHPFRGETEAQSIANITGAAPAAPLRARVPGVSAALEAVVGGALHKDPDERYATMADLMRALEEAVPAEERASAEELGAFVRNLLGERRRERHRAIREARQARGDVPAVSGRFSLVDITYPQTLRRTTLPSLPPLSEPSPPVRGQGDPSVENDAAGPAPASLPEPSSRTATLSSPGHARPPETARWRRGVILATAGVAGLLGALLGFLGSRVSAAARAEGAEGGAAAPAAPAISVERRALGACRPGPIPSQGR